LIGLGFVGSFNKKNNYYDLNLSRLPATKLLMEMEQAKNLTQNHNNLGVGLVGEFSLDKDPSILEDITRTQPRNLWLSFSDLSILIEIIQAQSPNSMYAEILKNHCLSDIRLFVQVSSCEEIEEALEAKANVIVLRCKGAGGYKTSDDLPLLPDFILQAKRLTELKYKSFYQRPFIVAAGGITTGEDMAKCLQLGADGVCLGTRMAATEESALPDYVKKTLLTNIKGPHVLKVNPDNSVVYSGSGTERIHKIKPAKEVMTELTLEAINYYNQLEEEKKIG
jgi:NAD(P)H-dependent flavin oxidoreductase YrpB (nitropropane dioxygenase family)